jgi:nucleotide-binding universal stress UspA family protein
MVCGEAMEAAMIQARGPEAVIATILVPTDFSPCSREALTYAAALAKRFGAKIVLFHVIETWSYAMTESLQWTDLYANLTTVVEPLLDGLVQEVREGGVAAAGAFTQGVSYDEIVKKARDERADLIVIGTHGRRGMGHFLMGSVAERVVRISPCPVLTVRGA